MEPRSPSLVGGRKKAKTWAGGWKETSTSLLRKRLFLSKHCKSQVSIDLSMTSIYVDREVFITTSILCVSPPTRTICFSFYQKRHREIRTDGYTRFMPPNVISTVACYSALNPSRPIASLWLPLSSIAYRESYLSPMIYSQA